ncbi:MAG TPA: VTT domain-containing protein [Anaerolineales bacterium]|nr:VTT domain-containing protein [Anaerolineales bacterium]
MLQFLKKYDKPLSIGVFAISILLSIAVFFIPLDPNEMKVYGYGGIFVITLLGAATLFIPGPTMVATFVIGAVLNPAIVAVVAGFGSAIGESTGYAAGFASRAFVAPQERKNSWYQRILHWMGRNPFLTIFLLDAIPNFVGDIAGLIAGRNKYSYWKFLLASFLGKTVRFSLSTYLGAALGRYFPGK